MALCALLVAVPIADAGAATLTPNRFDDPAIGGKSCKPPVPGECSLRGAAEAAEDGDTIDLSPGTYALSQGELELDEVVTIVGEGPGATTIEQTGASRVINAVAAFGLTIEGVTITGGQLIGSNGANGENAGDPGEEGHNAFGAGISAAGPVALTDVVVTGNQAFGGDGGDGKVGEPGGDGGRGGSAGGAGVSGGNPLTLTRVAITGNAAFPGEGGDGGDGTLTGSGGDGGKGGSATGAGASAGGAPVTVIDSLFAANVGATGPAGSGGSGGAFAGAAGVGGQGEASNGAGFFANGDVKMTNVTFAGNVVWGGTSGDGGDAGNLIVESTGGSSGTAFGGSGGAVAFFNGASGQLASVTMVGNVALPPTVGTPGAGSLGGPPGNPGNAIGARGGNAFVANAVLAIRDTIVAGGQASAGKENCALSGTGEIESNGHNLEDGEECIAAPAAGDVSKTPAGTGTLQDNGGPTQTLALLPGSAAIDAGEPSCVDAFGEPLAADQRGLPRLSPCDIGAFEVQPPTPQPPAPTTTTAQTPILKHLRVRPVKLRKGRKARVLFSMNVRARVSFVLRRKLPGIRSRGKCVRRTAKNRKGKRCRRLVKVRGAPKAFTARAGANKRAWRPRRLRPGKYRLFATPKGGLRRATGFTVLKRR